MPRDLDPRPKPYVYRHGHLVAGWRSTTVEEVTPPPPDPTTVEEVLVDSAAKLLVIRRRGAACWEAHHLDPRQLYRSEDGRLLPPRRVWAFAGRHPHRRMAERAAERVHGIRRPPG